MIEQIIVYGAIAGATYALLSLGFTLIYGVSGVVNLAHGTFYMLAAYMFYVFGEVLFSGQESILISIFAFISSAIFVGIISGILYRLVIHPVLGDEIAMMVVTVCLALIFQQIMLILFGSTFPPVKWPEGTFLTTSTYLAGITLQYSRILAFILSLILFFVVMLFTTKTKLGKAMRAVSQDREVAMLMGVNTARLYMLTMAISGMLAAIASILITTSTTMSAGAWMWLQPLALSFAIVILGGLGSIKGSLVGGFIIGVAEQAVAIAVPEGGAIVGVVPLTVMIIVLVIRPKGLFGKRIEMED